MFLRARLAVLAGYLALVAAVAIALWGAWSVVETVRGGGAHYAMAAMVSFGLALIAGLGGRVLLQRCATPPGGWGWPSTGGACSTAEFSPARGG